MAQSAESKQEWHNELMSHEIEVLALAFAYTIDALGEQLQRISNRIRSLAKQTGFVLLDTEDDAEGFMEYFGIILWDMDNEPGCPLVRQDIVQRTGEQMRAMLHNFEQKLRARGLEAYIRLGRPRVIQSWTTLSELY